ncbi:hypothetical protein DFS34DRAFT_695399 [Phlyctochytrium arcticum]|nr:hypothetical protein DFS34DRAFT_695399 [Phlyctochytrium arcticum]
MIQADETAARRRTRIPSEVLHQILRYTITTTTHHNPTLYACLQVSHQFFNVTIPLLWREPRIGARVGKSGWQSFVHSVLTKGGLMRYRDLIKIIEDVWLVVGGEEDHQVDGEVPIEIDMSDTHNKAKRDSAISLVDEPPSTTTYRPYSLPYVLHYILTCCNHLHTLRLHLHSDIPEALPWGRRLPTLKSLEIYMRVDDSFIEKLFPVASRAKSHEPLAPSLITLQLHSSNLSSTSLSTISHHTPNLRKISMAQVAKSRHTLSQTQMLDAGSYLDLIASHQKLTQLNIYPISNVPCQDLQLLPVTLQMLSITLSTKAGLTLPNITEKVLPRLTSLRHLKIFGGADTGNYMTDGVAHEEDILMLPRKCTSHALAKVVLAKMDLCRTRQGGFKEFYGCRGMPWAVDSFVGKWKQTWDKIELVVEG